MSSPTQNAQAEFKRAISNVIQVSGSGSAVGPLMPILINLLQGLDSMAIAQRAIYIKLEEIEKEVKQHTKPRQYATPIW